MAKGPSKKDYAASAGEQANAEVAQSEYRRFKTRYQPLLVKRMEQSQTDDLKTNLRGRANADVQQALSRPNLAVVENPTAAGDMAEARMGQLAEADKVAAKYKNDVGASVLARGRQQAAVAQQGLSEVSRLGTSAALAKAQAKADVAQSKWNAAAQIGSALTSQGFENYSQTKDVFTPGRIDPKATSDANGVPQYKPATSWDDRLSIGLRRNF